MVAAAGNIEVIHSIKWSPLTSDRCTSSLNPQYDQRCDFYHKHLSTTLEIWAEEDNLGQRPWMAAVECKVAGFGALTECFYIYPYSRKLALAWPQPQVRVNTFVN